MNWTCQQLQPLILRLTEWLFKPPTALCATFTVAGGLTLKGLLACRVLAILQALQYWTFPEVVDSNLCLPCHLAHLDVCLTRCCQLLKSILFMFHWEQVPTGSLLRRFLLTRVWGCCRASHASPEKWKVRRKQMRAHNSGSEAWRNSALASSTMPLPLMAADSSVDISDYSSAKTLLSSLRLVK